MKKKDPKDVEDGKIDGEMADNEHTELSETLGITDQTNPQQQNTDNQ